jgi:hypothetical protein
MDSDDILAGNSIMVQVNAAVLTELDCRKPFCETCHSSWPYELKEARIRTMAQRQLPLDCYVILHIRAGPPFQNPAQTPHIAADGPFSLSGDIWIEGFDEEFAIRIQKA